MRPKKAAFKGRTEQVASFVSPIGSLHPVTSNSPNKRDGTRPPNSRSFPTITSPGGPQRRRPAGRHIGAAGSGSAIATPARSMCLSPRRRKRRRKLGGWRASNRCGGTSDETAPQTETKARRRATCLDRRGAPRIPSARATFADRKRKFAELAAISRRGPQGGDGSSGLQVLRDEMDGVAERMEIALVTRMLDSGGGSGGRIEYKPKNIKEAKRVERYRAQSEQYLSMGLVDIAAACINYEPNRFGSRYLTMADADTIFSRAFNSTSDFPNIFQNVLNKALLARYELHMPTYRELAVQRPFNDFRPHPQVRAGEFPLLQPVTETGEIKYGTSTDTGETVSVVPYGVIFSISRTMLVNDDLGAIDQILGSAGDTVLIFENTTFFNMLLSGTASVGPTLVQDSTPVFNVATHANYLAPTTGAAPSITTIGVARQALRQMRSISGNFLNVPPSIILTGPANETVADQMVTSITPTLTTSVNPFSGRLRSVSAANISNSTAFPAISNYWYLFTDPARVPCFMYGYLNGANGPRTRPSSRSACKASRSTLSTTSAAARSTIAAHISTPGLDKSKPAGRARRHARPFSRVRFGRGLRRPAAGVFSFQHRPPSSIADLALME
jgi:hypothetical protein